MIEESVPVVLGVCLQDEALIWQSYTTPMQRNSWLLGLAFTDATFRSFNQTRGFVSGHVSVLIDPWPVRRMRSNRDPLLLSPPKKKISTRPHNQNKSTTRAFPAAMTSRKPSPFPASKQKTLRENVRVSRHMCVWCAGYATRDENGRQRGVSRVFF